MRDPCCCHRRTPQTPLSYYVDCTESISTPTVQAERRKRPAPRLDSEGICCGLNDLIYEVFFFYLFFYLHFFKPSSFSSPLRRFVYLLLETRHPFEPFQTPSFNKDETSHQRATTYFLFAIAHHQTNDLVIAFHRPPPAPQSSNIELADSQHNSFTKPVVSR